MRKRQSLRVLWLVSILEIHSAGIGAAAELKDVKLLRNGNVLSVTLTASDQSPNNVLISDDHRSAFIYLPDVTKIPPLPILDAEAVGLAFGMIERQPKGQDGAREGARISLIAPDQIELLAPVSSSNPNVVEIRFRLGPRHLVRFSPQPLPKAIAPLRDMAALPLPKEFKITTGTSVIKTAPAPPVTKRPDLPTGISADDARIANAMSGDNEVAIELGNLCMTSTPPNAKAARDWFILAANRGSPVAAYNLGQMSRRGVGAGGPDEASAAKWYSIAAKAEFGAAEYNLGLMLLEGRGIAQDAERGRNLLELANRHGYSRAGDVLKQLGSDGASKPTAVPKKP